MSSMFSMCLILENTLLSKSTQLCSTVQYTDDRGDRANTRGTVQGDNNDEQNAAMFYTSCTHMT